MSSQFSLQETDQFLATKKSNFWGEATNFFYIFGDQKNAIKK
jgi:hypothetical protein